MENADVKSIQFCKKTTVQPGAELPGTFGNKGPLWTRTAAGTKDVAHGHKLLSGTWSVTRPIQGEV